MEQVFTDVSKSLAKNRSTRISKPNSRFFSEDIEVQLPLKRLHRKAYSEESQEEESADMNLVTTNSIHSNIVNTTVSNDSSPTSATSNTTVPFTIDNKLDFDRPFENVTSQDDANTEPIDALSFANSSSDQIQSPKEEKQHPQLSSLVENGFESSNTFSKDTSPSSLPASESVEQTPVVLPRKRGRPPSAKTLEKRMREAEAMKQKTPASEDSGNSRSYLENEENSGANRGKSEADEEAAIGESIDSCSSNDDDDDDSSSNQDSACRRGLRERRQPERLEPIQRKRGRPSLSVKDESLLNTLLVRPLSKHGKTLGRPRKRVPVADVLGALQRNPEFLSNKNKCACKQRFELILSKLDDLHKDQLSKLHRRLDQMEKEKADLESKVEQAQRECEETRNKMYEQRSNNELYQKICEMREKHASEISQIKRSHWVGIILLFISNFVN